MSSKLAALFAWICFLSAQTPVPPPPAKMAQVLAILREASAIVPSVPKEQRLDIAGDIAQSQVRAGDMAQALETWRRAGETSPPPLRIAVGLAQRGDAAGAFRLMDSLPESTIKDVTYYSMVLVFQRRGEFASALAAARRDQQWRKQHYSMSFISTYREQIKAGDRQGAAATLKELRDALESGMPDVSEMGAMLSTYTNLVRELVRSGDRAAATEVVQRLATMEAAEQNPGNKTIFGQCLAVVSAYTGDFTTALKFVKERKVRDPNAVKIAIANEQARQGDPAAAMATIATTGGGEQLRYLEDLVAVFGASGDFAGAQRVLAAISENWRLMALAKLAENQVDRAPGSARSTADLALKNAQVYCTEFKGVCTCDVQARQLLAGVFAKLGDMPTALATAELANACNPDDVYPTPSIDGILEVLAHQVKTADALKLARKEKEPWFRAHYLQWLAESLMDTMDEAGRKPVQNADLPAWVEQQLKQADVEFVSIVETKAWPRGPQPNLHIILGIGKSSRDHFFFPFVLLAQSSSPQGLVDPLAPFPPISPLAHSKRMAA